MLFDTSPTEDQGKKKARKKPPQAAEPPPPVVVERSDALQAILNRPAVIIARLDDHIVCHRCQGSAHDIIEDYGREWQVECCFCGSREDVPAIAGYLKPKSDFVFRDGRQAGKSIDEACATPQGREYVEWAAKEHKRPSVREACAKYLLTASATVG